MIYDMLKDAQWLDDIQAAKELQYPDIVIEKIEREPSPYKRSDILRDARRGKYDSRD